jgi:hypothetical protein
VAEGVDLPVEVAEGGADLDAVVLEGHHVEVALLPERGGPLPQDGEQVDQLPEGELGERAQVVVGGVHEHLAAAGGAGDQAVLLGRRVGESEGKRLSNTATRYGQGSSTPPGHSGQAGAGPAPVAADGAAATSPPGRRLRAGEISTQAPVRRS